MEKILKPGSSLTTVSSGHEAVSYMIGEGRFADRKEYPFPALIITDLKMELGDGFEVLKFLDHNPAWSVVPRIVFTGSDDPTDVRKAYSFGASAYHVKPQELEEMKQQMRKIIEYWATSEAPSVDHGRQTARGNMTDSFGAKYPTPTGGVQMERPNTGG